MVIIDTNLVQYSDTMKVKCKACNKRIAGIWPDGLCIDCYIMAEKMRVNEC